MDTKLSLERVVELDKKWGAETSKFLQLGVAYGNPPPLPLHEEYSALLLLMAKRWGIDPDEFLAWVGLQRYINLAAQDSCEELEFPEEVADRLGIKVEEFQDYFHNKLREIREALADDEDDFLGQGPYASDDWDDDLDILEEAGRRGLA